MAAESLRALQAPLKARYKDDPDAALVTLRASSRLGEGVVCHVDTGRALAEAGLHPATGGNGLELCSGDAGVTMKAVATAIGVEVKSGSVHAEGDLTTTSGSDTGGARPVE